LYNKYFSCFQPLREMLIGFCNNLVSQAQINFYSIKKMCCILNSDSLSFFTVFEITLKNTSLLHEKNIWNVNYAASSFCSNRVVEKLWLLNPVTAAPSNKPETTLEINSFNCKKRR
jgi:hypothetical protein